MAVHFIAQRQADGTQAQMAVFAGPRDIRVEPVTLAEPGPQEVLVRLEGCGVCASNLPVWEGRPWFDYPLAPGAPGHEGWGRIAAVGSEVQQLSVGERVAALTYHAYGEYDIAEASAVVPLPPSLDEIPFPGEPLGCAMNIFTRSAIQAGQWVAIVGIGFLGALLTGLATAAGAQVVALSRRPFALDMARALGASETLPVDDYWGAVERVKALTGGMGCERVIEAVGVQMTLDLATELTREQGRLIIAGYHQDGSRQVNMQQWNWRGLNVINAHERDPKKYVEGVQAAVEAVANGTLDPTPLYTHRVSLAELPQAFELMQKRPEGFLKALLML